MDPYNHCIINPHVYRYNSPYVRSPPSTLSTGYSRANGVGPGDAKLLSSRLDLRCLDLPNSHNSSNLKSQNNCCALGPPLKFIPLPRSVLLFVARPPLASCFQFHVARHDALVGADSDTCRRIGSRILDQWRSRQGGWVNVWICHRGSLWGIHTHAYPMCPNLCLSVYILSCASLDHAGSLWRRREKVVSRKHDMVREGFCAILP